MLLYSVCVIFVCRYRNVCYINTDETKNKANESRARAVAVAAGA